MNGKVYVYTPGGDNPAWVDRAIEYFDNLGVSVVRIEWYTDGYTPVAKFVVRARQLDYARRIMERGDVRKFLDGLTPNASGA